MADPERHHVLLSRPGQYYVREALEFEGLCLPEGAGVIRLRFSKERGKTLDFPVSAEGLSALVRTLYLLHGTLPEEMSEEIAQLSRAGKLDLKK